MIYSSNYKHCNNSECKLKHTCYRYKLHLDAIKRKIDYILYVNFKTENNDKCNYYKIKEEGTKINGSAN